MKKDFRAFAESNSSKPKQDEKQDEKQYEKQYEQYYNSANKNATNDNNNVLEDEINKFSGKSESELMKELFSIANKNRQEGTLNNTELESFTNQISQFLTAEQKVRLDMLINQLKD